MKQTILNVLKDKSFSVLSSEHAKESIATEIIERLKKKGFYTEYRKDELEKKEAKKGWVCQTCGKSTFETDYDYLVHPKLHLGCALEEELKGKDIKEQYLTASAEYYKDEKRMKPSDWWNKENPQLESEINKLSEEIIDNKYVKYIYESPDGGKTLYRREFGSDEKELIKNG